MSRCNNCGHDTTEHDPYGIIEELMGALNRSKHFVRLDEGLMARARECLRDNPMVQIEHRLGVLDDPMMRLPVTKYLEFHKLGFDELTAPVWTTKRGQDELLAIVKRAEQMHLPLPHEEKNWLRKAIEYHDAFTLDPPHLPNLRHLLRR